MGPDRILMRALSTSWMAEADRLLLPRRSLGVRVVGVRLVGLVMADYTAYSGAELAMPGHVAGDADDDGTLNASLGIRAAEPSTDGPLLCPRIRRRSQFTDFYCLPVSRPDAFNCGSDRLTTETLKAINDFVVRTAVELGLTGRSKAACRRHRGTERPIGRQ
jgi:hypothetical protein